MSGFGDWTADDAVDHEPPDPEQVARHLHLLRQAAGLEITDWDTVTPGERAALVAVLGELLAWLHAEGDVL